MCEPAQKTAQPASQDAMRGLDLFWIMGGDIVINHLEKATDNSIMVRSRISLLAIIIL